MAHAYTPGLKVSESTTVRYHRLLPLPGDVLVSIGDRVRADMVVARSLIPGNVELINLANALSLPPSDAAACVVKMVGCSLAQGDVLARTKGVFGLFKQEYRSRIAGTIETISEVTGQIIVRGPSLPIEVTAYISGIVSEVMPLEGCIVSAEAALVQGIFGIGGETSGPIRFSCKGPDDSFEEANVTPDMAGQVVVGGARATAAAIRRAVDVKAAALVTGGIDDEDLHALLGRDLGVAVTGSENIGLTLVLTEGFGDIGMARRTYDLLRSHEGREASVNGATQIRAGVLRPEVVIPLKESNRIAGPTSKPTVSGAALGAAVRAIRSPNFGRIGRIVELPRQPHILESGAKARVFEVEFENGERAIIPRANIEMIEQ